MVEFTIDGDPETIEITAKNLELIAKKIRNGAQIIGAVCICESKIIDEKTIENSIEAFSVASINGPMMRRIKMYLAFIELTNKVMKGVGKKEGMPTSFR